MFRRSQPELESLKGLMWTRIKSKFLCLEGKGQNSNVWKFKTRIPMFQRIRSALECLEEEGKNSNV